MENSSEAVAKKCLVTFPIEFMHLNYLIKISAFLGLVQWPSEYVLDKSGFGIVDLCPKWSIF